MKQLSKHITEAFVTEAKSVKLKTRKELNQLTDLSSYEEQFLDTIHDLDREMEIIKKLSNGNYLVKKRVYQDDETSELPAKFVAK